MAVDIAGEGSVRVDEAGHVIGERFQGDAGCLAVKEPPFAQVGLHGGGQIGRRSAQRGGNFRLAANARVENFNLRNLDSRAKLHLVASVLPIELSRSMLSPRKKIGEAEPASRRQPRGAGHVERSAGRPIKHGIVGRKLRRVRVDGRAQRPVTRRAVQIRGDARLAFKRAPREQCKAAQVAGDDICLAVDFAARKEGRNIGRRNWAR